MKIAIEALGIHYFGGGRTATLNLFEALFSLDSQNEYLIFLSQPEPSLNISTGNVTQRIAPVKNRFWLRLWAQFSLPRAVRGYDLVHFAKNLGVFGVSAPTIVTMYDLTTLVHPELFPWFDVWYWRNIQKQTLLDANAIITISKTTADDILRYYQVPRERIRVIYPAYANHFKRASKDEIDCIRDRYRIPETYILHVGRIDRKKNLTVLVRAFAEFRQQTAFKGKLVLVGEEYLKSKDNILHPTIEQLELTDEVIFTGRVPDSDVPALFSGALVTVFPSLHEGFGLAHVEAMACGSPLIASSAGAVREVIGEAAILLDSIDINSIVEALIRIVTEPILRQEMQRRGLARAEQFRGEHSARQTLRLYEELGQK
ncbi:MAG TPA: glycosyltransferase family 1 protein [Anaerolineales bacterium]|nr:glycosyltransferase family 1 protein [Anaerolineales bacterium]